MAKKPKKKVVRTKTKPAKKLIKPGAKKPAKKPIKPKVASVPSAEPSEKPPKGGEFYVKVENVVSFVALGKPIPLNKLVSSIENTEYEPEQFPGLVYRISDPRAAALIFSSGKIVCTGAKSIEKSKIAIHKVVDRIRSVGIPLPRKYNIQVENIVASSKIQAKLNLEEIAFALENAEYEPEQFPGLVYRISEPRVAFLLFSSGKIICTGAHTIEAVHTALRKLKERLEEIGIKVIPAAEDDKTEKKPEKTGR